MQMRASESRPLTGKRTPAPSGEAHPGPWRGSESRPLAGKRFGRLVRVAKECQPGPYFAVPGRYFRAPGPYFLV